MSEVIQRNAEEVQEIAESKGLVCILPTDYEIQIDDDSHSNNKEENRDQVLAVISKNGLYLKDELRTKSPGGNTHIYYRSEDMFTMLEKIALQSMLGSDPVRELLSLIRFREGSTAPSALFETQEEAAKVQKWRDDYERGFIQVQQDNNLLSDIPY